MGAITAQARIASRFMHANPLLQARTLPYQLPPFDRVDDQHYREGFTQGMGAQLHEVAAITGQDAAPSFDNTIVALERSGQQLDRAMAVFFNLIASNTNDVMQQLESELAPLLAAHEDAIALDSKLFARVNALYERRAELALEPEAVQLVERYHAQFVRAGARLSDADKAHLKTINAQISCLTTQFKQNVFKATSDGAVVID